MGAGEIKGSCNVVIIILADVSIDYSVQDIELTSYKPLTLLPRPLWKTGALSSDMMAVQCIGCDAFTRLVASKSVEPV